MKGFLGPVDDIDEQMLVASKSMVDYVLSRTQVWSRALSERLGEAQFVLTGSLVSGTFAGPKESRNPRKFSPVVEADVAVMLRDDLDPHRKAVWREVAEVTGSGDVCFAECPFWDPKITNKYTLLYGYPEIELPNGLEAEIEFSLMTRSCIDGADPTHFWREVFSPEEQRWLRECRIIGRRSSTVPYDAPGGVMELKDYQLHLARSRILAGFALGKFGQEIPRSIENLVKSWQEFCEPDMPAFAFALPRRPESPGWLRGA